MGRHYKRFERLLTFLVSERSKTSKYNCTRFNKLMLPPLNFFVLTIVLHKKNNM